MRLIRNKICRRRFKLQFRVRKWLFGRKRKALDVRLCNEDKGDK